MYALVDIGASNNFINLEVAKKLKVPYVYEKGWLKAVNSHRTLKYGVARNIE